MGSWEAHDRDGVPPYDVWRARAGYALLGTALLTSPLLLPFGLALLMTVLHGTPLGPALLQHLHLVVIGSLAYCLAALGAACVFCRPVPLEAGSRVVLTGARRVPDPRHLQFQRWLVAHGQHVDDMAPVGRFWGGTEISTRDPHVTRTSTPPSTRWSWRHFWTADD